MLGYEVKLEVFEGPLALLMHLLEKNQIDIYDIPIAEITEQYLAYLQALEEFDIDVASEFLVMAATLLQIKSRMLLPRPPRVDDQEEETEEDPRQELVERLLEYRKFKQMALLLEKMAAQREKYHTRAPQELIPVVLPPESLNLDELIMAFAALWESAKEDYEVIAPEEISVQDKMYDIVYLLQKNHGQLEFSQAIIRNGTRNEFIATFLALLELMRLRRITIIQQQSFGAIYLKLRSEGCGE